MKPLIYVVEDDLNIQNVIKIALQNSQYEIVSFENGKDFFSALKDQVADMFILDIMLPGMDGIDIITRIKRNDLLSDVPILVISAKSTELDKVIGLDTGADDYLTKPFGVLELVSRVKALLRRTQSKQQDTDEKLDIHGYTLNLSTHELSFKDESVNLTTKQFELLTYLMKHHQKVVSREKMLNKIWGYDFVGESRTLDVHIKELRKHLKQISHQKNHIETIRGVGYKLNL